MIDIWSELKPWILSGKPFALATVTQATRSTPRSVGATLAVGADGSEFVGSVSAGCVENEVIEASRASMEDGQVRQLFFGPSQEFPWEVALTCGGRISVRVEPFLGLGYESERARLVNRLTQSLDSGERVCLVSGPAGHALLGDGFEAITSGQVPPQGVMEFAQEQLREQGPACEIAVDSAIYFVRPLGLRKRLFIVGAGHIAVHLVPISRALLFETIVIDPRDAHATEERFPSKPDQLIHAWPEPYFASLNLSEIDALAALAHDPKIDDGAILAFLRSSSHFVGALGSQRSQSARLGRLRRFGIAEKTLARIRGPVGLAIGSRTPAEIAVSIAADLVRCFSEAHRQHAESA